MPGKVIYFLFIVLIFALFSVFNLNNKSDVSFIFYTFKDMPVYLNTLFSFVIGCIITLPFFLHTKRKKEKKGNIPTDNEILGIQNVELKKEKKSWFSRKNKNTEKVETLNSN